MSVLPEAVRLPGPWWLMAPAKRPAPLPRCALVSFGVAGGAAGVDGHGAAADVQVVATDRTPAAQDQRPGVDVGVASVGVGGLKGHGAAAVDQPSGGAGDSARAAKDIAGGGVGEGDRSGRHLCGDVNRIVAVVGVVKGDRVVLIELVGITGGGGWAAVPVLVSLHVPSSTVVGRGITGVVPSQVRGTTADGDHQ